MSGNVCQGHLIHSAAATTYEVVGIWAGAAAELQAALDDPLCTDAFTRSVYVTRLAAAVIQSQTFTAAAT